MVNYGKHFNTQNTPQSQPIPGTNQVANSAGGFSFELDHWKQMDRFLILGAEGGSYYAGEHKLTEENALNLLKCIKEDGKRAVSRIVEISDAGRAHKNDAALFALALAASKGSEDTRKFALDNLSKVARIGTHLFHFAEFVNSQRGWGRGLKRAIANWYSSMETSKLSYQAVKYQQRDGWSHRDLLRLAHPKADAGSTRNDIYHWMIKGWEGVGDLPHPVKDLQIIWAFEKAKKAENEVEVAKLITEYHLPLEAIPTDKRGPRVWEALLPSMGSTALLRNLGNLSKCGLLANGAWDVIKQVTTKIKDFETLKKDRVHPLSVLAAINTYGSGHGIRGHGSWDVVPDVLEALNSAFYASFDAVLPANKRFILGVDVSGSMDGGSVSGIAGLTPRIAAAAMAMVTYRTEAQATVMGFSDTLVPINITRNDTLEKVIQRMQSIPMGSTDCSLPMTWALKNRIKADVFMVLTDSETWSGRNHPVQALQKYRREMGIPAKLIVVGMVSNKFSIADPNDSGMLDVVGFDTATPEVIRAFAADEI